MSKPRSGPGEREFTDKEWEEIIARGGDTQFIQDQVEKLAKTIGVPEVPEADEFLEMKFPERKPVMGPWSTQQLSFVYAPTGAGKSMFALGLAYALSQRQTFCGWEAVRNQRVLFVDGEMTAHDLQDRLKGLKAPGLFIANLPTWGAEVGIDAVNLTTEEGQNLISAWVLKHDIETVILDNLMSLAWKDGTSMNSDELWQPVRRWCIDQRSEGRSVVIVDHTNAAGDIFGSKTKLWHVDQALRIDPLKEDEDEDHVAFDLTAPKRKFKMRFTKQRGASIPEPDMIVTAADVGQEWTVEAAKTALKDKAVRMRQDGLTIRDIAEELGTPKSTVARWVKDVVPPRVQREN